MAVTFLEPGGDADFANIQLDNTLWGPSFGGAPTVVTDFVHGGHKRSIKYRPGFSDRVQTPFGVVSDTGGRFSFYIYLNALPSATTLFFLLRNNVDFTVVSLVLTSGGVLQLWRGNIVTQIGSNGATLSTGTWYRISLAFTITSSSVNRFEVFVNGTSSISGTNVTSLNTASNYFEIGNLDTDASLDFRSSDHYADNSSSLLDTGNIWVTAKRPNANGTTNGFTTRQPGPSFLT